MITSLLLILLLTDSHRSTAYFLLQTLYNAAFVCFVWLNSVGELGKIFKNCVAKESVIDSQSCLGICSVSEYRITHIKVHYVFAFIHRKMLL